MTKLRLIVLAALALLTLVWPLASLKPLPATAQEATPVPLAGANRATAILVSATNDPLRVPGSDGADHLEYDLIITNAYPAPVTLTSIEVRADGATLLSLEGDTLLQATQPFIGLTQTSPIPTSGVVAVVMDVAVPRDLAVTSLSHHIAYDIPPDDPTRSILSEYAVDGPELTVSPQEAIVISPPLLGTEWVAYNGCCPPSSLHRSLRLAADGARVAKSETFAIDWIRLQDGAPFMGDGAQPEQWFGFGAEVLAVADGTVVFTRNHMPEEMPMAPVQHVKHPGDYGGNQIILEIAPGVYAFYAHLQPGSVSVAAGDVVTAGQPMALLGNTGNTTAPHLHFGLLDAPDALTGNSLPMVFTSYTLTGQFGVSADPEGSATPVVAVTAQEPEEQTNTLPLDMSIVTFP